MELEAFVASAARVEASRPSELSPALAGLWHLKRGEWDTAHELVQDDNSAEAAWVHALVHRIEGDLANARYWYGRAGREPAETATDEEWRDIATALLGEHA